MDNDGLQNPLDLRRDTEELEYIHANFDKTPARPSSKRSRRLQSRSQTRARTIEEHLTDLGLSLYTFEAR
jgi:hypothetical protein